MIKTMILAATSAAGLMMTVPSFAVAADDSTEEQADKEKFVDQLTALTAAIEGLRDKEGDTVAEGGGEMEGALLSSFAMKAAANKIAETITAGSNGEVLIAAVDDVISSDQWLVFDARYAGLCNALTQSLDCSGAPAAVPGTDDGTRGGSLLGVATAALPFFSSLLRSETEISGLSGIEDSALLARATLQACRTNPNSKCGKAELFAPVRLTGSVTNSIPYKRLLTLQVARNKLAKKIGKKGTDAQKAAIKASDDFIASQLTADAKGNVPLLDAIRAQTLNARISTMPILTVGVEKAAGTLLKRKGLDVALGAPSTRASGGVIISYTVESDVGGNRVLDQSAMIACQTKLTELKKVHQIATNFAPTCR